MCVIWPAGTRPGTLPALTLLTLVMGRAILESLDCGLKMIQLDKLSLG